MARLHIEPLSTEERPLDWFKPDEQELARHNDPEETRLLGENMLARGQLQEVAALENGRMIYAHGRYLGKKATGQKTLRVKIYPASLTETEIKVIRAAENLHRKGLTSYRKWLLCRELLEMNPQWQQKDLVEVLNQSESMITRLVSPSCCIPAVQDALKDGKIGIGDCCAISKLPPDEQAELLVLKLRGASRDQIEKAGRKKRSGCAPAVRVARIKCPVAGGAVVQISGEGICLDDAIEAAQEWIKEAKKASEQGLDAKTFERVCRDKAKAGGKHG